VHWMMERGDDDRCAEGDSLGERSDPAERDERREHPPVRIDRLRPDENVLGRPDRVEAELLRCNGRSADPLRRGGLAKVGQDQSEMHDEKVLRERVSTARVARLATIDPDGRPHLVPIVFALSGNTVYSAVDAKPKRSRTLRRIENARERPNVAVLVDHYDDKWERLWWVRLRGRGRVLDGGEEAERALSLLAQKYEQYRETAPGFPVLAIYVDEWRSWSASA
jgi:PPOX class probable F420-dependent enzyme